MTNTTSVPPSGIGRPLDFTYPTNRVVLALVPVGGLLGLWLTGGSPIAGFMTGAASVFLGWALARELAPDHPLAAFGASALSLLSLIVWPEPSLAAGFTTLLLTRIVNRTVGLPATLVDGLVVVAATLYTAWALVAPTLLAVAGCTWIADRLLEPKGPRRHTFFGLGSLVAAAVGLALRTNPPVTVSIWLTGAILIAFGAAALRLGPVRTRADLTDRLLSRRRIQVGMVVAWALAAAALVPGGAPAPSLGIVWGSMAALAPVLLLASAGRTGDETGGIARRAPSSP